MQAAEVAGRDSTAVPPPPVPQGVRQRSRFGALASALVALLWGDVCARAIGASAASGIAERYELGDEEALLAAVFWLFLLVCGLAVLRMVERRRAPLRLLLGLPKRGTMREEWGMGAALGWGIALAGVLPLLLMRGMNVQLWTEPRAFWLLGLSVAALALATLAHTLGVFGYGFQRLIEAMGPVRATLVLMLLVGVRTAVLPVLVDAPVGVMVLVSMVSALLLCLCWLRTHGLWLGWGLHFAWSAAVGVLFGLPLGGDLSFASVVDTRVRGPLWLTGGSMGPSAAALSLLVLAVAIAVLVRVTGDYAWDYTHAPLIPAGYDVTIAPPAAHVEMEQAGAVVSAASLVQILPAGPVVERRSE